MDATDLTSDEIAARLFAIGQALDLDGCGAWVLGEEIEKIGKRETQRYPVQDIGVVVAAVGGQSRDDLVVLLSHIQRAPMKGAGGSPASVTAYFRKHWCKQQDLALFFDGSLRWVVLVDESGGITSLKLPPLDSQGHW